MIFLFCSGSVTPLRLVKKMLLAVHADKVHIKQARERLFDKITLVLAHESLVYEHARQLICPPHG